jgi:hypothetical protein
MSETKLDLDALSKLLAEATPGPWHREHLELSPGGPMTLGIGSEARAVCIVNGIVESPVGLRDVAALCALRNSAEQLIAAARRLEDGDAAILWLDEHGWAHHDYAVACAKHKSPGRESHSIQQCIDIARDLGWKEGG